MSNVRRRLYKTNYLSFYSSNLDVSSIRLKFSSESLVNFIQVSENLEYPIRYNNHHDNHRIQKQRFFVIQKNLACKCLALLLKVPLGMCIVHLIVHSLRNNFSSLKTSEPIVKFFHSSSAICFVARFQLKTDLELFFYT